MNEANNKGVLYSLDHKGVGFSVSENNYLILEKLNFNQIV